jgi:uncharacterized protein YoxC
MDDGWDLVGGDPAPGDPGWIEQQTAVLGQIAQEAEGCYRQLDGIFGQWASSDWSGLAADTFRSHIGGVIPDLEKTTNSYGTASSALGWFSSELSGLQAAAQQALGQAQSAESELVAATAAGEEARQVAAVADEEAANFGQEISRLTMDIRIREQQLGPQAAVDPTLQSWASQVRQLEAAMSDAWSRSRQAALDIAAAQQQAEDAQNSLNSARRMIADISNRFQGAVRQTTSKLEVAAAQGIRNLSFVEREWDRARADIDKVSAEALRDGQRFTRDVALLGSGHLSGLQDLADWEVHDIVAAAPLIHDLTAVWADAANDMAAIVNSKWFPVVCLAVGAVAGFVVAGPAGAVAGAEAGLEVGKDAPLAVDAEATEADTAEVASDELMRMDGKGDDVDMTKDVKVLEGNAIDLGVDAATAAIPLPDVNDVLSDALNGQAPTVVKTAVAVGTGQVESWGVSEIKSKTGAAQ